MPCGEVTVTAEVPALGGRAAAPPIGPAGQTGIHGGTTKGGGGGMRGTKWGG